MKLVVCVGSSCHLRGSRQVVERLRKLIEENKLEVSIEFSGIFCLNRCQADRVSVKLDGKYFSLLPEEVDSFFQDEIMSKK